MAYPSYLKSYAPQINLSYPKRIKSFIFEFYEIIETDEYEVRCKECEKKIFLMKGCHVTSSYTSGLTFHLQKHPDIFLQYLEKLKGTIIPDTKSKLDHFKARERLYSHQGNNYDSARQYEECERNFNLNPKNCAGVIYVQRDIEIFRNKTDFRHQNEQILQYLHKFSNRNIPLNILQKQSNSIIRNDENIVTDLKNFSVHLFVFFIQNIMMNVLISTMVNSKYLLRHNINHNLKDFFYEIEKYPEFQNNKSLNVQILKEARRIENTNATVTEMNRLLKIILSILTVYKPVIKEKFQSFFNKGLTKNGLFKPRLGIQLWGPSFKELDIDLDLNASENFKEKDFSTFRHAKDADCPSYTDNSKKKNEAARFTDGKAHYPCNFTSCLEICVCIPCNDPDKSSENESFACPDHKIDHPEMFNESEDFSIPRRQFVEFKPDIPIFKRPKEDKFLCPPKIKLAQMKRSCLRCEMIFNDHVTNHHILHNACQICSHLKRLAETSFNLTCHICLKKFRDKYILFEHVKIHNDEDNPNYCHICLKGFSTKFNYNNHKLTMHGTKKEEYKCDLCEKIYASKSNLNRHIETKHSDTEPQFECSECEKKLC